MTLPVDDVMPQVIASLRQTGRVVLQAPPGAGKTSRVPLALLDEVPGKIIMLEPRRLAARAAAERLADQLGEKPGGRVGFRMRGDSVAGTRIEVVTEGILTRMLQSDASLPGIDAVIFDEFHERSLQADLGLALVWEVRGALREDLWMIVMSATLDAGPVATLLNDAPVITSDGRSYPVDLRWLPRPAPKPARRTADTLPMAVSALTEQAATETEGGILVFLPGAGEIERTARILRERLPPDCVIQPLYGALPFAAQRAAVRPLKEGRKVVLATSIAETSLTIEDIRVVVDAGLARRARYDPRSGMSRLVTEPVSKAEATQRSGRAGRVAPGVCFRNWAQAEEGRLTGFAPPEIANADLCGFALELAEWGAAPDDLALLTPPPPVALAEATALLAELGALRDGQITEHGKALARLPLHPRLAHMVAVAGPKAALLAAILSAHDRSLGADVDLAARLRTAQQGNQPQITAIRKEAKRIEKLASSGPNLSLGQMVALAYPDRVGLRRKGDDARYVLSGGKGAYLDNAEAMAGQRLIVAVDLDGDTREARIRAAAALSEAELRALYHDRIGWSEHCIWSKRAGRVEARKQERFGALVLDDRVWTDPPQEAVAAAMLDGVRQIGLVWSDAARRFRARVALLDGLPDMTDAALLDGLEDWLLPYLKGVRSAEAWRRFDMLPALRAMLDWDQMQRLDTAAPAAFETPLGRKIPIDYSGDAPEITLRLQEMFGVTTHPMVGRTPLRITLLSPGHKPVQTTQDIVGFWDNSYADVRRDMRGRYPKHPWPEDPRNADPTLRTKRKGG